MMDFTNLRINEERLWQSLMDMAKIGATPKGGVCRLALTELDGVSRDLFVSWCKDAGMDIHIDKVGNIFARRPGKDASRPPIATGSHLDTQPTGGRFDGVYGVLAGLEVVRSLNDADFETDAPIEVVVWTNEEGSRFPPAMMGSGVHAGIFPLNDVLTKKDGDGISFQSALSTIGYDGPVDVGTRSFGAYIEAHIEQGPILEAEQVPVGIVTGAQGQRWYELTITGMEAHAGPTPMRLRKDALVAAAGIIQEVNAIALRHQPFACGTCGVIESHPNSRNVIPGQVFLTIDLRHPDDAILSQMDLELREACKRLRESGIFGVDLKEIWHFAATPFDKNITSVIAQSASDLGYGHREIVSGAGHDAVYVAGTCPTGMIFVPCENGISHNEIENAHQDDIAAGCQVLLRSMAALASA